MDKMDKKKESERRRLTLSAAELAEAGIAFLCGVCPLSPLVSPFGLAYLFSKTKLTLPLAAGLVLSLPFSPQPLVYALLYLLGFALLWLSAGRKLPAAARAALCVAFSAVLALTASATPEVAEDIMQQLKFSEPHVLRTSFARSNLCYVVRNTEDKHEHLLRILNNVPGTGIVYVRTREKTETIAGFLNENGITAGFYHGGMGYLMRAARQDDWIRGRLRVMVATNAFGMGIDKADVRIVVHYDPCDSLEAYYQEAGRAGRDGKKAYAVLLLSEGDTPLATRRMQLDFPPVKTILNVYEALFNYLSVAVGDGKGTVHPFNVYEFAARFRFFVPTALNAIKILQTNGYLILTDESDNPPRIRFVVPRDELYRIRVDRKELDHLITVLLRRYTGLFSDFAAIDEDELAHLSGYTVARLHELFKKLWQLHIIRYIPGGRSPMLILSEERLPVANVRISPESYARRKAVAEKRLDSMFRYATEPAECRSVLIQRYFGETDAVPCGACDRCLEQKKRGTDTPGQQALQREILSRLSGGPADVRSLAAQIRRDIRHILECVTVLLREKKIIEESDGKLRINP